MDDIEAIARAVAPSRWAVMDRCLEETKRKYRGQNVAWPTDQFHDKESMATADAILAALTDAGYAVVRKKGEWYYAEGYQSDECCFSPAEVIEEINPDRGYHVIQVDVATPLPSIWCAVHIRTNEEMDALETDDREVIIECASEDEARAAIAAMKETGE